MRYVSAPLISDLAAELAERRLRIADPDDAGWWVNVNWGGGGTMVWATDIEEEEKDEP